MTKAVRYFPLLALLGAISLASSARADGETLMPGTPSAIMRGGATAARPTDPGAMLTNPAGLVELDGPQLLYGFDTAFDNFCEQPYGYYGWGVYLSEDADGNTNNPDDHRSEFGNPASAEYGNRRLDKVCNSGLISPVPQLVYAMPINPYVAIAFGFIAPAITAGGQWGGKDGTIETDDGPRPTPTRYQFIRQQPGFVLNPTAAVAVKPLPWLSFGMTLQVLMGTLQQYVVMAMRAGTSPANDAMAKLSASDFFMPALTFAAYAKPTRNLRFAATFNWSDGFDGSGDLSLTTNTFHQGATGSELLPLNNDAVKLGRVRATLPWTATLAARFVQPRPGAAESGDPLKTDLWDIELDASYVANRTAGGGNRLNVTKDFTLAFRSADGVPQMPLEVTQDKLEEVAFERHTLDVLVLRLGSSVNLIPNRLQVSAGGFFQTRGVEASYASIDNFGFMRIGVGLGVTVRLGRFDVMAAYAHIFQETLDIAPPAHQDRRDATDSPTSGFDQRIYENDVLSAPRPDPRAPAPGKADGVAKLTQSALFESDDLRRRVVNAGKYTAGFDILSIGAIYHF